MSAIETYLQYIASKVWARDVRTAIVNAIRQCYDDVHNPTLNTEALQAAIQAKIDAGQMAALTIGDRTITAAKLALGVIPTPDTTLSQSGVPADAKTAGDEITALKADLDTLGSGLSDEAKTALLNCFAHVAWTDSHGQIYYDALEEALYEDGYPRFVAVFNPGDEVIYDDFTLNDLKQYLTVKLYTSATQVEDITTYTLSGNLSESVSTVTVSYDTYTETVSVPVVVGRPLTMNDVETYVGITGLSIDATGTCTASSSVQFCALVLKPEITHIRYESIVVLGTVNRQLWEAFARDSTDINCSDSNSLFRFTKSGNAYNATKDMTIATVTNFNNSMYLPKNRIDVQLVNGTLRHEDHIKNVIITNADRIGKWGQAADLTLYRNARVYDE